MSDRDYYALRALAVATLQAALMGCGAGLPDEIDSRPLNVAAACANPQPDGTCKPAPKVGE